MVDNTSRYISPLDFKHTARPLVAEQLSDAEVRAQLAALHATMSQVIVALNQFCGIGTRAYSQWDYMKGSALPLLFNNQARFYVEASESISYGQMVNLHASGGQLFARKANATNNTKPVDGFCNTQDGVSVGETAEVILRLGLATYSGLTPGARYYLSTTGGQVTTTAPVAAGNIEQYLGIALTSSTLLLLAGHWIQH